MSIEKCRKMYGKNIALLPGEGDVLLDVSVEGNNYPISFDMLKSTCPDMQDLGPEDIEHIYAEVCDANVVCCITTAQGQGGVVFVWDTKTQNFVHFSDGEYAVKATIYDQNVYVIRQVSYWGTTAHLTLDYCPLGTQMADKAYKEIPLDESTSENLSPDPADYEIIFNGEVPTVRVREH